MISKLCTRNFFFFFKQQVEFFRRTSFVWIQKTFECRHENLAWWNRRMNEEKKSNSSSINNYFIGIPAKVLLCIENKMLSIKQPSETQRTTKFSFFFSFSVVIHNWWLLAERSVFVVVYLWNETMMITRKMGLCTYTCCTLRIVMRRNKRVNIQCIVLLICFFFFQIIIY